ncbi:type II toxin-antitoxin system RnlB family antitoxin [Pseudoalteromonas fuliginea]|uniref:type II toxin-antitoxin system RnlB family antitoxin n=1 Tax=Pseudoalteromonas fuliginea TaxID=1872678 RepID=UPI00317F92AA
MTNIKVFNCSIAVVTELPQQPVLNQFSTITEELLRSKFKGKILFDLLISKGLKSRFVEAHFDGKEIIRESLRISLDEDIPNEIVSNQSQFFANNINLLNTSMLSSKEIRILSSKSNTRSL